MDRAVRTRHFSAAEGATSETQRPARQGVAELLAVTMRLCLGAIRGSGASCRAVPTASSASRRQGRAQADEERLQSPLAAVPALLVAIGEAYERERRSFTAALRRAREEVEIEAAGWRQELESRPRRWRKAQGLALHSVAGSTLGGSGTRLRELETEVSRLGDELGRSLRLLRHTAARGGLSPSRTAKEDLAGASGKGRSPQAAASSTGGAGPDRGWRAEMGVAEACVLADAGTTRTGRSRAMALQQGVTSATVTPGCGPVKPELAASARRPVGGEARAIPVAAAQGPGRAALGSPGSAVLAPAAATTRHLGSAAQLSPGHGRLRAEPAWQTESIESPRRGRGRADAPGCARLPAQAGRHVSLPKPATRRDAGSSRDVPVAGGSASDWLARARRDTRGGRALADSKVSALVGRAVAASSRLEAARSRAGDRAGAPPAAAAVVADTAGRRDDAASDPMSGFRRALARAAAGTVRSDSAVSRRRRSRVAVRPGDSAGARAGRATRPSEGDRWTLRQHSDADSEEEDEEEEEEERDEEEDEDGVRSGEEEEDEEEGEVHGNDGGESDEEGDGWEEGEDGDGWAGRADEQPRHRGRRGRAGRDSREGGAPADGPHDDGRAGHGGGEEGGGDAGGSDEDDSEVAWHLQSHGVAGAFARRARQAV